MVQVGGTGLELSECLHCMCGDNRLGSELLRFRGAGKCYRVGMMRNMLCLCGGIVFAAALIWVPMRSRAHKISAAANVTTEKGQVVASNSARDASASVVVAVLRRARGAVATAEKGPFLGFDRNIYPGDDALPILRKTFAFAGFWLGPPPGEKINTWKGKRELMKSLGFGFAALYSARPQNEVKKDAAAKQKALIDAKAAVAGAKAEGFAANTVIFLDIEDGGRLSPTFHTYLRAWADELSGRGIGREFIARGFRTMTDGVTIRTADDIREHMHGRELVYWVYNDVCPPAPGCVASKTPPVSGGGVAYAAMWQYVQSPRRKECTAKCAGTYNADGNCYAPGDTAHSWFLDLNSANSADPSSRAGVEFAGCVAEWIEVEFNRVKLE